MAESNEAFYGLAQDDELVDVFDQYERLPERGVNPALDAFVDRKNISIESLLRLGARLSEYSVLAFAFPGGIKYRDIITDKRWNWVGSEFKTLKIVHAGVKRARVVIVAEGETDAARLTLLYPEADIAVLPGGADPAPHTQRYAAQLNDYELVLLGHDYGVAGEHGAAALAEHLTTKFARWLAPIEPEDNCGWGDVPTDGDVPALPSPDDIAQPLAERPYLSVRELLSTEPEPINSYFEDAILPHGGSLMLHGSMKSYKSFQALDIGAALAQAEPWCHFEPLDEPQRVMVMQFEIPPAYYRERIEAMRAGAAKPDLFDENFLSWRPLSRPRFQAGNLADEDAVLKVLDEAGVTIFIFDPIRRGVGVADLNSEAEVRPVLHFFERCNREGIAVVFTHHDNKTGGRTGGGSPLDATGSGAFGGDVDTIVSVAIPKGHELQSPERNLHFLLRNAPSPSARSMCMTDSGIEYSMNPIDAEGEHASSAEPTSGSEQPEI